MALGDQGKALRITAKAKGWDPEKIEGFPDANLANLNRAPDPSGFGNNSLGTFPGEVPARQGGFPEDHGTITVNATPFNTPDASRENQNHATSGADPNAGKGRM